MEIEQHLLPIHESLGLFFVVIVWCFLWLFKFLLFCLVFVFWPLFSHYQTLENLCCSWLKIRTALPLCLTVFCSFIGLSIVLCTQ